MPRLLAIGVYMAIGWSGVLSVLAWESHKVRRGRPNARQLLLLLCSASWTELVSDGNLGSATDAESLSFRGRRRRNGRCDRGCWWSAWSHMSSSPHQQDS